VKAAQTPLKEKHVTVTSSIQICYGVIVTVDIDLGGECKGICALVSCKGMPINSHSPPKKIFCRKETPNSVGELKG
jgi:hypothetical protein